VRLYGKKFLRNSMKAQISAHTETRDAMIYDVLPAQRLVRCKIQGSDEYIVAWYPLNLQTTPSWLRPGNAVRIAHVGAVRGRIEVVGHGLRVPQSGTIIPAPGTPADGIMSGGAVTATSPPTMDVDVAEGVARIGGSVVGFSADTKTVSAAPATNYFRYDMISVGDDGVIDYTSGSSSIYTAEPTKPTPAANHVAIVYILVGDAQTTITNADIGELWLAPTLSSLLVSVADDDLAWGENSTTIQVTAKDQHGNTISPPAGTWYFKCKFLSGNGTIETTEEGSSTTEIGGHHASTLTFTYTRDGNDPGDDSPTFELWIETPAPVYSWCSIILRDTFGNQMPLWVDPYYFS